MWQFLGAEGGRRPRAWLEVNLFYMSGLEDLDNIIPGGSFDAFADADNQSKGVGNQAHYIHVRTQQRHEEGEGEKESKEEKSEEKKEGGDQEVGVVLCGVFNYWRETGGRMVMRVSLSIFEKRTWR